MEEVEGWGGGGYNPSFRPGISLMVRDLIQQSMANLVSLENLVFILIILLSSQALKCQKSAMATSAISQTAIKPFLVPLGTPNICGMVA